MKLFFTALIFCLSISCGSSQSSQNNENLTKRNEQILLKNEVKRTVKLAQEVEKAGRDLDYLRNSYLPEDKKYCQNSAAEKRKSLEEFKAKVEKLPDEYRQKLSPLFEDLDKCFGCEKKDVENCKKARA